MTSTVLGWKKGRGLSPISATPTLTPVTVSPQTSQDQASTTAGLIVCTADGCGKQFKRLVPMAQNHFKAKHKDLDKGKDAYKTYLKDVEA